MLIRKKPFGYAVGSVATVIFCILPVVATKGQILFTLILLPLIALFIYRAFSPPIALEITDKLIICYDSNLLKPRTITTLNIESISNIESIFNAQPSNSDQGTVMGTGLMVTTRNSESHFLPVGNTEKSHQELIDLIETKISRHA